MTDYPTGTIAFLFTDIQGSTRLLQQLGAAYEQLLADHHRLIRAAIQQAGGVEVSTAGDSFFAVFPTAGQALEASIAAQRSLAAHRWPEGSAVSVRMGLHVGTATMQNGDYAGLDVHRAARISNAGHGGQILISSSVYALVGQRLPDGVAVRDLGQHRLKDLEQPERLYQVVVPDLNNEFPPIRTTDSRRRDLPVTLTPFVGREEELAELGRLLADPQTRIVTILGPGGIGKTRLAREVAAAHLSEYSEGVYFVELAPLTTADNIPVAVADALNIVLQPGQESPQEQLIDYLSGMDVLLVLDNFEHILDGVDFVHALLQAAPQVKALVTTRERLRLNAETVFALDGLPFPDLDTTEDALTYGAVRLFVQSAQRVRPDFELDTADLEHVVRICRLVHGTPLAIVLAAAWFEVLSAQEIAEEIERSLDFLASELRDLPERQRSIRAVFASSWQRLRLEEQRVFMRLSVFRGGLTRAAAEGAAQATLPMLSRLVDSSLVRRDRDGRYQIHELLRQYAEEQLGVVGQMDEVRDAHSAFFGEFLSERDPDLKGRRQLAALQEIEADWENVRVAWQWAVERRDFRTVDKALESLYWFCIMRSKLRPGQELLRLAREGLSPAPGTDTNRVWGRVSARAMRINFRYLEPSEDVRARAEIALAIAEARGDESEKAFCLWALGMVCTSTEDHAGAIPYYEQSLGIYKALGDRFYVAWLLQYLGRNGPSVYADASAALTHSLDIRRAMGDRVGLAYSMNELGNLMLRDGQMTAAESYLREAYAIQKEMGNRQGMAENLIVLAVMALNEHDLERTEAIAREARAIADDTNSRRHKGWVEIFLAEAAYRRDNVDFSRRHLEQAELISSGFDISVMYAAALGLSRIELNEGDYDSARQHLRRGLEYSVRTRDNVMRASSLIQAAYFVFDAGRTEWATSLLALALSQPIILDTRGPGLKAVLEEKLSPDRFQAAWARGLAMRWEDAVEELLVDLAD